jgi:hypothetical protein
VRLLGTPKNNLGRSDLATLSFRIVGAKVAETSEGDVWTGVLRWAGETTRTIRDALEQTAESSGDKTATGEAGDWLQERVRAALPTPPTSAGRARKRVTVKTRSGGRSNGWASSASRQGFPGGRSGPCRRPSVRKRLGRHLLLRTLRLLRTLAAQ